MVFIVIIRQIYHRLQRNSLPYLAVGLGIIILAGTFVSYFAERSVNTGLQNLWDCFWWTIVTISTVGYGDRAPITVAGRIIAMVCMVGGPVIMASALATIGVTFYSRWMKGTRGMAQVKVANHLILCGWNEKARNILNELRSTEALKKLPVTIIDENCETKPADDSGVTFVRGNATDVKTLKLANIDEDKYAIVLAGDDLSTADQKTVLSILTIEKNNSNIISSAELIDSNNADHLRDAGCDIIINTSDMTSKLMAMSLLNSNIVKVVTDLVSGDGEEIYRTKIPKKYAGYSFIKLLQELKISHNVVLIGVERDGESILNPPSDFTANENDYLVVVAREQPVI
jgi:voltage-gated potassium channel